MSFTLENIKNDNSFPEQTKEQIAFYAKLKTFKFTPDETEIGGEEDEMYEEYKKELYIKYNNLTGKRNTTTLYKEVLIEWDEDADERVLEWYDNVPEWLSKYIYSLHEHEGYLEITLKPIKDAYLEQAIVETFNHCKVGSTAFDEWGTEVIVYNDQ